MLSRYISRENYFHPNGTSKTIGLDDTAMLISASRSISNTFIIKNE